METIEITIADWKRGRRVRHSRCCTIEGWYREEQRLDELRSWVQQRRIGKGAAKEAEFSTQQIMMLRTWFKRLGGDDGQLSVDDLADPLISIGVADTRGDVARMCEGQGTALTFRDFLQILRPSRPTLTATNAAPSGGQTGDSSGRKRSSRTRNQRRLSGPMRLLELEGRALELETTVTQQRRRRLLEAVTRSPGAQSKFMVRGVRTLQQSASSKQARHPSLIILPRRCRFARMQVNAIARS